jgi:hypothetical protein
VIGNIRLWTGIICIHRKNYLRGNQEVEVISEGSSD